jgi:hypothetical protein
MEVFKRSIIAYGGRWETPINHKNFNYLDLESLVISDRIVWAGAGGNPETGVFPDKPNSFLDLAKARESKSIW